MTFGTARRTDAEQRPQVERESPDALLQELLAECAHGERPQPRVRNRQRGRMRGSRCGQARNQAGESVQARLSFDSSELRPAR